MIALDEQLLDAALHRDGVHEIVLLRREDEGFSVKVFDSHDFCVREIFSAHAFAASVYFLQIQRHENPAEDRIL